MPIVSDYTALLSGANWNGQDAQVSGKAAVMTYSFSKAEQPYLVADGVNQALADSFSEFTDREKAEARSAFDAWGAACGLAFYEAAPGQGDIQLGNFDFSKDPSVREAAGFAYLPSRNGYTGRASDSDVFVDAKLVSFDLSFLFLHEIGYTIGLKHPFDGDPTLASNLDNHAQTVMSYTGPVTSALGPLDIQAVQFLYGGPGADRSNVAFAGFDSATSTEIQVATGAASALRGSYGHDVIIGGAGDDTINGGLGDNIVDGGGGTNVLVVDAFSGSATMTRSGSGVWTIAYAGGSDTASNIARVRFLDRTVALTSNLKTPANHAFDGVERFFDSATGDHFYTTVPGEAASIRASLPTYHDEGAPWRTPDKGTDTLDVYRFFDAATGAHFLTTSAAERDNVIATLASYRYEGVAFEAFQGGDPANLTLERFFNTQNRTHHYAASAAEIANILSGGAGPGWVDEGAGFGVTKPA